MTSFHATYPSQEERWVASTWNPDTGRDIFNEDVPEGLTFTEHDGAYDHHGEQVEFSYRTYKWPEAGPTRYLNGGNSFVVDINGRHYHVSIDLRWNDDHIPVGANVAFTLTDEPETEFDTWDEEAEIARHRETIERKIEASRRALEEDPNRFLGDLYRLSIRDGERELQEIEAGDINLRHPFDIQVFGQPHFRQNEMFPVYQGQSAMLLCNIENGWGDCGNVHIFFACDSDGVPCKVWLEASCA